VRDRWERKRWQVEGAVYKRAKQVRGLDRQVRGGPVEREGASHGCKGRTPASRHQTNTNHRNPSGASLVRGLLSLTWMAVTGAVLCALHIAVSSRIHRKW